MVYLNWYNFHNGMYKHYTEYVLSKMTNTFNVTSCDFI